MTGVGATTEVRWGVTTALDRGVIAVSLLAGTSAVILGDGREELVGTSVKAKRCDDTEHWHEVGSGSSDR